VSSKCIKGEKTTNDSENEIPQSRNRAATTSGNKDSNNKKFINKNIPNNVHYSSFSSNEVDNKIAKFKLNKQSKFQKIHFEHHKSVVHQTSKNYKNILDGDKNQHLEITSINIQIEKRKSDDTNKRENQQNQNKDSFVKKNKIINSCTINKEAAENFKSQIYEENYYKTISNEKPEIKKSITPLKDQVRKIENHSISVTPASVLPKKKTVIARAKTLWPDDTSNPNFETIGSMKNDNFSTTQRSEFNSQNVKAIGPIDFNCFFPFEINSMMVKVIYVLEKLKVLYILKKNFKLNCHKDTIKFEMEIISLSSNLCYIRLKKTQASFTEYVNIVNKVINELSKQQ
jgi:hypothetical protein